MDSHLSLVRGDTKNKAQEQKKNTIFKSSKDVECIRVIERAFFENGIYFKINITEKNRLILCTQ